MKTIEEAARDYSCRDNLTKLEFPINKELLCALEEIALKEGVKIAEEWISVEKELPINQDIVLVKTDLGCVTIAYLHGKKSGFIVYGEDAYIEFGNITHWRPIKRK